MNWLHWLNPLGWHWHHGDGYLIGGGASATVFSALTLDTATTGAMAILTVAVAIYSAYRTQRTQAVREDLNEQALKDIHAANRADMDAGRPPRFPQYLPPPEKP